MKTFIASFLALLITWIVIGSPFIFGDGYGYYHAGKVLVQETKFATQEKPEYYNYTGHAVINYKDKYITPYTVGNAILWLPFLGISNVFDSGNLTNDYYKAFNGHSLADGIAISLSAIIFAALSITIITKSLLILGFSKKISYFSTLTTFIGSFVLAYTIINSSYSHIYEIFTFSLIVYICLKLTKEKLTGKNSDIKLILSIGALSGLLVLIRPFNLLLIIPVAIFLLSRYKLKSLNLILGAIPAALIFFGYNLACYGSIFTTGYSLSEGFVFIFNLDRTIQLLFSDIRGWYIYTPIMIISTVGLLIINKQKKNLRLITLVPVVLIIFGYTFWQNWWAGDSAGQRFLLVLTPIMSIGTAAFINRFINYKYKKVSFALVTILSLFSFSLFILYRFTPTNKIGSNRTDYQYINSYERFGVSDILSYHYNLIKTSENMTAYIQNLQQGLSGGRSLSMIYLGLTKPLVNVEDLQETISIFLIPTPSYKNVDAKINILLETENGVKRYSILNLDTSILHKIDLICTESCFAKNFDLKESQSDFEDEYSQKRIIKNQFGNITIYVSPNLKLESPNKPE